MKTKKVYPFVVARIFAGDNESVAEHNITFDAREVAYYHHHKDLNDEKDVVTVGFKSGKEIDMYLGLDDDFFSDDNLITAIDMVQYSHFWHDNEDSTPDNE